jgi:ATP-dependent Lon protease
MAHQLSYINAKITQVVNYLQMFTLTTVSDDETGELIPILPTDENEDKFIYPDTIPILPIRNTVLFPGVVIPITVGRQKSIKLVKKTYKGNRIIGVVAQKNQKAEEPGIDDIYKIGTIAQILKLLVLPDGNTTIIIQGKTRFQIDELITENPYLTAKIITLNENFPSKLTKEQKALIQSLKDAAAKILKLNPEIPKEAQVALDNIESSSFLTHFLSSNLNVEVHEKQLLLEINDGIARAEKLLEFLFKEIQILELKNEINNRVHHDLNQQQRDYFLRQQMKILQDELGYDTPEKEIEELKTRASQKNLPEHVLKHIHKETDKLLRMNPQSPEYPVNYNYCELLVDLPWTETTEDNFDLVKAREILEEEHQGLEKIKERLIEYLAVLKLKGNMKAPILCFYGPPGVGKTSLGKSIARALGRKYVRMSLGGLRDEAEIRGHRRTYIGAMPGRIIQNIKKAGVCNPVFVLDEIDKIASDFRGDPSSALLEVLDPQQNTAFYDNYLELDYDLSKVLFIATANSLDTIQPALRDRMEIIELNGYSVEEKVEICRKHIIPKVRNEHGLKSKEFNLSEKAIVKLIESYTRESGVRNLEREVGALARKIAKKIVLNEPYKKTLQPDDIVNLLGTEYYENEEYNQENIAGVAVGLAWTPFGGDILYIESTIYKGKGKLVISGQLGDVMKESATAALSFLKTHAESFQIDTRIFEEYDLHIHVPAGAVPKDGPSAGITILTSLASIFTQRKVKPSLAMTGEITLRGKVLPVGGIKEKLLAAKRSGIKEIILCYKNKKDVFDINPNYLQGITIHYVKDAFEVLKIALLEEKVEKPLKFTFESNIEKSIALSN